MVDWGAVSGFGVGALVFAASVVQARKGEKSTDKDNRFAVLQNTVDQLQEQIRACEQREASSSARYRQQDEDLDELRDRHRECLHQLDAAHDEIRDMRLKEHRTQQRIRDLESRH